MIERQFMSHDEVRDILLTRVVPPRSISHEDQVEAATDHALGIMCEMARVEDFRSTYTHHAALDHPSRVVAARMAFVALPIVEYKCEHIDANPQPLVLCCDPPVLCCMVCYATETVSAKIREGFHWDNQCDCCGVYCQYMVPVTINIGPLMVAGNVCLTCSAYSTLR